METLFWTEWIKYETLMDGKKISSIDMPDPSPDMIRSQATKILRENHPDVPWANIELYKETVTARDRLLDTQWQLKQIQDSVAQRIKDESIKWQFKETIDLVKDVNSEVGKKLMEFINSHPKWAIDISAFIGPKWEKIPAPTNMKEYKEFTKKMVSWEIATEKKIQEEQKKISEQSTDPEYQNFVNEVAKIEAEEQRIGKVWATKVGKQASDEQMRAWEKKKESLIENIGQHYGLDANEAKTKYDQFVGTPIEKQWLPTKETARNQLDQIEAFLTDHTDITNPKAKEKLEKVLNGETVKDNGIDYNKEINQIMERNLKPKEEWPTFESAIEALKSPEMKTRMEEANKQLARWKVTKTSNNLYHTTSVENIDNIMKEWLTPWKEQRFKWVWSKNKISFWANEETASYYGKQWDTMLRTKTWYKPKTLDHDLLAWWKGTYTVTEKIPPEQLEIKRNWKRESLIEPVLNEKILNDAVMELSDMYRGFLKEWQEVWAKYAMGKILGKKKQIQEARLKQPTIADISKLFSKYTPDILEEALKIARKKHAITPEDYVKIEQQLQKALANPENKLVNDTIKGQSAWLSDKQKVAMLHRNNFNDLFKDTQDHKVNFTAVSDALRKDNLRLHIVSPWSFQRLSIPFSLMGNKSSTAENILAPLVIQWLQQGKNVYIEPFWGAGTSILLLPHYFQMKPDLKVHINIFDNEKYTLIDRVKGKDDHQIYKLINDNYNKIMGDITNKLMENEKFKTTMEDMIRMYNTMIEDGLLDDKEWHRPKTLDITEMSKIIGTKFMGELTELVGFYPNLAKQYFKERIDSKVAIKWELTESFKERLDEKLRKDWESQGLEWTILETYITDNTKRILNEESKIFEKQYPGMSKDISTIIDKYDIVKDKMTPDEATQTSIARLLRQRGTSGQRIVSAWEWFQNVEWVAMKLWYWLEKYRDVLDKYEWRIDIQNKDGQQFIEEMWKKYDWWTNVIGYNDPPYWQSAQTYIKATSDPEVKKSLERFSNPEKLAKMYAPLKNASMIMTNDINWPYMTAMKELYGDRLNSDILGYREWTTPTSLITTTEFNNLPSKLWLWYYTLRRNPKFTTMEEALKEEILPKIAKGLEKPLVKMFQNFSLLDEAEALKMVRIKEQMERWTIKKEEAEAMIGSTMNDQQKRALINKFYTNLRRTSITWWDAVRLFKTLEKYMNERWNTIDEFKNLKKLTQKKAEIDAEAKEYLTSQLDQYSTENPTGEAQRLSALYEAGDTETIYDYRTKPDIQERIDSVQKVNINSLSNDEIQQLTENFRKQLDEGIDEYKYYKKQEKEYVDDQIEKTKPKVRKEDFAKMTLEDVYKKMNWKQRIKEKRKNTVKFIQQILDDLHTQVRWADELGVINLKEQLVDKPITRWRDEKVMLQQKYINERSRIAEKYNERFRKHEVTMIGLHLLLKKDRWLGIGAFIEYVNYETPWLTKKQMLEKIEQWKSDKFLTEKQQELVPTVKEIFDFVADRIWPTYQKDQNKLFVRLNNYFPVVGNKRLIEKTPRWVKKETSMLEDLDSYGSSINQGFTKQAKGGKIIPIVNVEVALFKHINDGLYYAHMQEPLRRLTQIVNWLEEDLGTRGYQYMADYIDRLKKQGNIHSYISKFDRIVEKSLVSLRKGILAVKIPLTIIQMSDLFKSYWVTGQNPAPALWEIIRNKEIRNEIKKVSGHLRHREIDDPVYTEESWITGKLGRVWDLIEKYWMMPIVITDRLATSTIFWTAYKWELSKIGKTPRDATPSEKEEAWLKADTIAMKVASDPSFVGVAKAVLTNRGFKKFFTLFQNYSINQSSQFRWTGQTKWFRSTNMGRLLLCSAIARTLEEMIRQGYKKVTNKKTTFQRKLWPDKYKVTPLSSLINQVPMLGNMIDVFYGDTPLMQYISKILTTSNYKDMDKFTKNVIFSLGRLGGMPMNPIEDMYNILNGNVSTTWPKLKTIKTKSVKFKKLKLK